MTRFVAIHQFHSGTAVGDAITDQLISLQREFRRRGIASEVYAEFIAPELADRIWPIERFCAQPSTLLLVHHSMGHSALNRLLAVGVPIVTLFHSVTPSAFFTDQGVAAAARQGIRQLRELARHSLFGIADSNHNRREMMAAGFQSVEVLPVRTDYREFRTIDRARTGASPNWLFVGRVVPNKNQVLLVEALAHYRQAFGEGRLDLVGDVSYGPYHHELRKAIAQFGLDAHVKVHGKLSHAELLRRYEEAGVFVCMSRHEGFGVPLLEAMAAGLPVVALNAAAAAETLGGAGVLIDDASPIEFAAAVRVVLTDSGLRERLVDHQSRRLERFERFDLDPVIDRLQDGTPERLSVTVQIQGPLETSYSLAVLNRQLAEGLAKWSDYSVSARPTEGYGSYYVDTAALAASPQLGQLIERGVAVEYPDVVIRQMFPPRVDDSTGALTLQYFGWEESAVPPDYVRQFNRHLDGIGAMSSFVKDALVSSGVTVPIEVCGVAVDAPVVRSGPPLDDLAGCKSFRFLHVGSAFPRKGVDILLRAYFDTFSGDDDVTLILKTFPNPHNEVGRLIAGLEATTPNPPHVCWIDRDLERADLDSLFFAVDCYVHPARGEGFGLPVAEAMLTRIPVIAVAATGLADLVDPTTAAVVGHTWVAANSHLSGPGSRWAEPDLADLRREMRAACEGQGADIRAARVETAERKIRDEFSRERVTQRWVGLIESLRQKRNARSVSVITTFNSRCGIAEYSANLYRHFRDFGTVEVLADCDSEPIDPDVEPLIHRVWPHHRRASAHEISELVKGSPADVVHIQYNMGFFTVPVLGDLLYDLRDRPTVLTLHRTRPLLHPPDDESLADISDMLRQCGAIIVHQQSDAERLADYGLTDNVRVVPLGTSLPLDIDRIASRAAQGIPTDAFVVGSYGFLLPHKGLLHTVQAVGLLRSEGIDAHLVAACALHTDQTSAQHLHVVRAAIDELGLRKYVTLETSYLAHAESWELLGAADVVAMPYAPTEESASAALRSILPVGRAVVATDLPIFADARDSIRVIPHPVDLHVLAAVLRELADDPSERQRLERSAREFARANSWAEVARKTEAIYRSVIASRRSAERGTDTPLSAERA